jgi:tRNA pseudouridine38-40 synthase
MKNFRLDLRYDGTDFAGWQVQPGLRTVQGEVERALGVVVGSPIRVFGSGRTDAGVHALRQVSHFRAETALAPEVILRALRGLLTRDVTALRVTAVSDRFDARRDALRRTYRYRLCLGRDPFLRRFTWEVPFSLEREPMEEASSHLAGERDFTSFAASTRKGKENTVRVERAEWRWSGRLGEFEIEANRFLHHMVRNIVGTLIETGRGARPAESLPGLIEARDRTGAGPTAPARGLFLVRVGYGEEGYGRDESEGGADEVLS